MYHTHNTSLGEKIVVSVALAFLIILLLVAPHFAYRLIF
jgi:hypothetical protein